MSESTSKTKAKPKKKPTSRNASTKAKAQVRPPPLAPDDLAQRGEDALALVERHPEVEERLEPGTVPNLRSDLDAYTDKKSAVIEASTAAIAATRDQNRIRDQAHALVSAIRSAVEKSSATAAQKKRYGVGVKVAGGVLGTVTLGNLILKSANAKPEEARQLGILAKDLDQLREHVGQLKGADAEQTKLIARKPQTTAERNAIGNRIWAAIKSISSRGIMAFATDARIRARFDALDDLPRKRARG